MGIQTTFLCQIQERVMKSIIEEKDKLLKSIKELSENVISKNVAMDKENKRLKLALKQSEFEKNNLKKEIEVQRETLDATLKENVVLNETIRLKESINDATRETEENEERIIDESNDPNAEEIQIVKETLGQKQQCDECDFETCVPKYIKGHKAVKHKTGQYQCQRGHGCKSAFKTLKELDSHIKSVHTQASKENASFNCTMCDQSFDAKAKLRIHNEKQHMHQRINPCENCGKIFKSSYTKNEHMNECTVGFQTVNPQPCRYFMNGFCTKGEFCSFSHGIKSSVPLCRNGQRCGYLANGVCSFFHPGVGVLRPRLNSQSGPRYVEKQTRSRNNQKTSPNGEQFQRWCRYMEDCSRVPNCPFSHHEQDFPPLSKNNPPETIRNQGKASAQHC